MKKTDSDDSKHATDLDQLIAEITTDAYGDDEQLWAFLQALEDGVPVPCDAFVIGEPVSVVAFDYDGNQRRGLVVRCRREGGSEHVVAASEVALTPQSSGGHFMAAYRQWLGLDPLPEHDVAPAGRKPQHKVAAVKPRKQWRYAGHPYLSGEIQSARLDVAALGLVPLKLEDQGLWTPDGHYWGEEDEPIEAWAEPIIARGPRRAFEMEQIVPGSDPDDFDRMLWLNPSDNQGVRFLIDEVRAKTAWEDREES